MRLKKLNTYVIAFISNGCGEKSNAPSFSVHILLLLTHALVSGIENGIRNINLSIFVYGS